MPVEQSAIQLMPLPELWPPLDQPPATATEPTSPGNVQELSVDAGPALPRQFAILLAEVLAGVRQVKQLLPWMSARGNFHLRQLMPLFNTGHQPRILRVLTTRPVPHVVEMTMIVAIGPRIQALAIRLEHSERVTRWLCTDIEAA
jgi:hypothetical protein